MRYLILLIFICLSTNFNAQPDPIKWGKVSPVDLAMTTYLQDTTADAVVLCDYGFIGVEYRSTAWKSRLRRTRRIKILKESGLSQGDVIIPYYSKNKSSQVTIYKAQVISPNGEKQALKRKDFVKEQVNEYRTHLKFSIPNIQVGSVIEYQYEIISDRITTLPEWYFQGEIPVKWSELRVSIPEWLEYVYLFQGTEKMSQEENKDGSIELNGNSNVYLKAGRYIMENVPSIKDEIYMTSISDYKARLQFQLQTIRYPSGLIEPFMSTWEKVAKELDEDPSFGHQYTKKKNFKELYNATQPLIASAKNDKEKVEILYDYLNQNIEWDGFLGISVETTLNKSFVNKKASANEINLMLLALLKAEGIIAYPLLLSTRSHGKMVPLYPMLRQFNHVILLAEPDGEQMLLDLGDAKRPMGYPRVNALNKMAWLMDMEDPRWLEIIPRSGRDVFSAAFELKEDGELIGKFDCVYSGYNARPERRSYENEDEDNQGKHWEERLTERHTDIEIISVKNENLDKPKEVFKDFIECSISGAVQKAEDFLYFSPVLYSGFSENKFKLEKREYPVEIPYPFKEQFILNLTLPEGYEVAELPEMTNIALPNKGGSFKFLLSQTDNTLQVISKLNIKQLYYRPEEYKGLKDFFDIIAQKHAEQVVLKKKN